MGGRNLRSNFRVGADVGLRLSNGEIPRSRANQRYYRSNLMMRVDEHPTDRGDRHYRAQTERDYELVPQLSEGDLQAAFRNEQVPFRG